MKALRAFNLGFKRINIGDVFSIDESRAALFEVDPVIAIRVESSNTPSQPTQNKEA